MTKHDAHSRAYAKLHSSLNGKDKIIIKKEIQRRESAAIVEAVRLTKLINKKDPVDVLRLIRERFSDMHAPLAHVVLFPAMDEEYTVGDLINDTLKKYEYLDSDENDNA